MTPATTPRWSTARIWTAAFVAATALGSLFVLQEFFFAGVESRDVEAGRILAEQLIPWYAWAALTPLMLALLGRARADADSWPQVLRFLEEILGH